MFVRKRKFRVYMQAFTLSILIPFLGMHTMPVAYAQSLPIGQTSVSALSGIAGLNLPQPGTLVHTSPSYTPVIVKGITVYPDNPFKFDFIVDSGDSGLEGVSLKQESEKLVRYFLASLTIPENDFWVNLSPYEKDRIIPDALGETEIGRDMLAQDYLLKQITASLIHPEDQLGEQFWKKVYKKAYDEHGTTSIPVDTFNKVWIMPDTAVVYENDDKVFVIESRLKVMLESDYLAAEHSQRGKKISSLSGVTSDKSSVEVGEDSQFVSSIVKDIIIPELEKEVNEGKNFAQLRQIYHSLILAAWFKNNLKSSILNKAYSDQRKIKGISLDEIQGQKNLVHPNNPSDSVKVVDQIYHQYLEAYKKGVFNYIKEDYDSATKSIIPRKYFSGGMDFAEETGKILKISHLKKEAIGVFNSATVLMLMAVSLNFATPSFAQDSENFFKNQTEEAFAIADNSTASSPIEKKGLADLRLWSPEDLWWSKDDVLKGIQEIEASRLQKIDRFSEYSISNYLDNPKYTILLSTQESKIIGFAIYTLSDFFGSSSGLAKLERIMFKEGKKISRLQTQMMNRIISNIEKKGKKSLIYFLRDRVPIDWIEKYAEKKSNLSPKISTRFMREIIITERTEKFHEIDFKNTLSEDNLVFDVTSDDMDVTFIAIDGLLESTGELISIGKRLRDSVIYIDRKFYQDHRFHLKSYIRDVLDSYTKKERSLDKSDFHNVNIFGEEVSIAKDQFYKNYNLLLLEIDQSIQGNSPEWRPIREELKGAFGTFEETMKVDQPFNPFDSRQKATIIRIYKNKNFSIFETSVKERSSKHILKSTFTKMAIVGSLFTLGYFALNDVDFGDYRAVSSIKNQVPNTYKALPLVYGKDVKSFENRFENTINLDWKSFSSESGEINWGGSGGGSIKHYAELSGDIESSMYVVPIVYSLGENGRWEGSAMSLKPQGQKENTMYITVRYPHAEKGTKKIVFFPTNAEIQDQELENGAWLKSDGRIHFTKNIKEPIELTYEVPLYNTTSNMTLENISTDQIDQEFETIPLAIKSRLDNVKSSEFNEQVQEVESILHDYFAYSTQQRVVLNSGTWGEFLGNVLEEQGQFVTDCDVLSAHAFIFFRYLGIDVGGIVGINNSAGARFLFDDRLHMKLVLNHDGKTTLFEPTSFAGTIKSKNAEIKEESPDALDESLDEPLSDVLEGIPGEDVSEDRLPPFMGVEYEVQEGESLSEIMFMYTGQIWDYHGQYLEIYEWNKDVLKKPITEENIHDYKILPGMKLKIPYAQVKHIVKRGETLEGLAKQYYGDFVIEKSLVAESFGKLSFVDPFLDSKHPKHLLMEKLSESRSRYPSWYRIALMNGLVDEHGNIVDSILKGQELIIPLSNIEFDNLPSSEGDQTGLEQSSSPATKGGIDFNVENLNIETRGQGIDFTIPNELQNVDWSNVEGLIPAIINIVPITNIYMLLGVADDEEDKKEVAYYPNITGIAMDVNN